MVSSYGIKQTPTRDGGRVVSFPKNWAEVKAAAAAVPLTVPQDVASPQEHEVSVARTK